MKKSKLIQMMRTLTKSEVRELGKFLEGIPYQKTGGVYKLYKHLKSQYPDFPAKQIDKEYIQKKLFKSANNPKKHLYDNASQLSMAVDNFLLKKHLEVNTEAKNLLLVEVYKQRKLDDLFFQKINTIEKVWEKKPTPGIKHLFDKYYLKKMCLLHPNFAVVNKDKLSINANELTELLDQYYFSAKLYWQLVNRNNGNFVITQGNTDIFISEILQKSNQPQFQKVSQIRFLTELTAAITNKNQQHFSEIREIFFENIELYNQAEKYDIFSGLTIFLHHWNHIDSVKELFYLHKKAAAAKLLIENGIISSDIFVNVVNTGCSVKELDWTQQFIEEYSKYLPEKEKLNTCLFCEATLSLYKKEYNTVLEKLNKIDHFSNIYEELQIKAIQLQCYYELNYDDSFDSLVKSFTKFIKSKNSVPDNIKERFLKFVSYAKKLKENNQKNLNLVQELQNEKSTIFRKWLIEKYQSLV